jgi:ketosteroid isomerase-like protein
MSSTSTLPTWLSTATAALAAGDIDTWMAIYTPDAVHELPFSRHGVSRRVEGRDEIAAYMSQLPGRIRFGEFDVLSVREVGDELIVEADGHHFREDDTPFDVRYVWFITLRDGLISHFRDYTLPLLPLAV